jgi:erythromycin esterase-like protein
MHSAARTRIGLASVQADAGLADMAPLKARLQDARIVPNGPGRPCQERAPQLKVRMSRFLVESCAERVMTVGSAN